MTLGSLGFYHRRAGNAKISVFHSLCRTITARRVSLAEIADIPSFPEQHGLSSDPLLHRRISVQGLRIHDALIMKAIEKAPL